MSWLFGQPHGDDRQPLLPQYNDDTSLQREVHKKLHSYQMVRALGKGYMPTNEQLIINLRTILAADILNPENQDLSDSGRLLVKYTKVWMQQFIELLQHKNSADQIQDFIWYLSNSRVDVDVNDLTTRLAKTRAKADVSAAYQSLQTVGSLLLTNSEFRIFLSDLSIIAREVFKDSAFTLSTVAKEAGEKLEPSEEERRAISHPGADDGPAPGREQLDEQVSKVSEVVGNGALRVAQEAQHSLAEKVSGQQKDTLVHRLKQAILNLRKRPDYSDSVSTISLLLKRYAMVYSRAAKDTVETVQEDVSTNAALDRAMTNFWTFVTSFGDGSEWNELETRFKTVMEHRENDSQFEEVMNDTGNYVQELLTDPDFFDHADEKFKQLRVKGKEIGSESSLRKDVEDLLEQVQRTLKSVVRDPDVEKLLQTSSRIMSILSPEGSYVNKDLLHDSISVFVPLVISAIQYIPIPRIEVATPEVDLLLENVILEPGHTVNRSSFLPYRFRVETYNDFQIRKGRRRTASSLSTRVTATVQGLSVSGRDLGFWLRAHSGILRLTDAGLASFALDERGIDISVAFDVTRMQRDTIISLAWVKTHVHKLNYTLRQSKASWLAWLFKPLLRPILRKVLERQIASAIGEALHTANAELVFARERLRAARVANPDDLKDFVRAVMARWQAPEDADVDVRVGIDQPGRGVFKGVYAPGSVVKLWHEEGERAGERVDDEGEIRGWRNGVFDVQATYMA